ncbi:hypothetical protein PLICRDRAFT_98173 [Plicaturopsis crispa FD-325 SS-3]|nr:hypothetical protein PLICRDRAFT_98173 [Plicaturopsis crispa FD-325 SS-3]
MDDDAFGSSVWGTPSESPLPPTENLPSFHVDSVFSESTSTFPLSSDLSAAIPAFPPPDADPFTAPSTSGQFDDFDDDFGDAPVPTAEADDDFGDFGDFGDAQAEDFGSQGGFGEQVGFGEEVRIAGPSEVPWEPLRLDPTPSQELLHDQLDAILAPVWANEDLSTVTTQDDIRQVEGISQILVTAESRDLYNSLFHAPPPTKPPNWTRSRIRRQHLISLGIPVNLDEILGPANGKSPLPPLQISTRPMSAPPGPRPVHSKPGSRTQSRAGTPRAGTPQSATQPPPSTVLQLGLGPKPQLDEPKMNELLNLDSDSLPLMPIGTLEKHLADLRAQTANTSALLTHLLQTREALQQDSETYNGLIAELIGEAQKAKTGKGRAPTKRGSGMI